MSNFTLRAFKFSLVTGLFCYLFGVAPVSIAEGREWSTPNGRYHLQADAIAFNDTTVVLKKPTGQLVVVELNELCQADRDYVESKATKDAYAKAVDQMQTWTAADGMKIRGRVLAYGRKELAVRRQLGKMVINGQRFASLDPLHQKLVLKILSRLENQKFTKEADLTRWGKSLGAETKTYPLEGVLMQLESGDEIGVPFFLFSKREQELLEPGWKLWLESDAGSQARQRESLILQSQAMEYQRDRERQQQIESLKLGLLATATGVVSIWEVILQPARPNDYRRTSVMVPATDSRVAQQLAMQNYPGFRVVGVRRASF